MSYRFDHLIGQDTIKRQLDFYLDGFEKTGYIPSLLWTGAKGLGKTLFAREFSKYIEDEGQPRAFLEINSSTIKNVNTFFEQIVLPVLMDNRVTVFFDEAHELPMDLQNALLTILNPEKSMVKNYSWQGMDIPFNFQEITFLFATTESDKLFPPLKDRMRIVDFDEYKPSELGEILKRNVFDNINVCEKILEDVSTTVRGNARNAVVRANDINLLLGNAEEVLFGEKEWKDLKYKTGINPYGVTNTEKNLLKILNESTSATLSCLSSKTGLSRTSIQQDHEKYLVRIGAIEIDGKRSITQLGRKIIKLDEQSA